MSDPDSLVEDGREKKHISERKKEKKRRKAERRLSETLAQEKLKLPSLSSTLQETEEEAKARRKKEKKEAKKLKKHKEASAAGQKATPDVNRPAKVVHEPTSSKSKEDEERNGKENRKRKERPVQELERSEAASGSNTNTTKPVNESEAARNLMSLPAKRGDQEKHKKKKAKVDGMTTTSSKPATSRSVESGVVKLLPDVAREREKEKDTSTEIRKGKRKDKERDKELVDMSRMGQGSLKKTKKEMVSSLSTTGESSSGSNIRETAPVQNKKRVQDQIDQIVSESSAGTSGRHRNRGDSPTAPQHSDSQAKSTREGTLEDAMHLTHKEMLVDRLYHSNQLKWLQEERGLIVKTGRFSDWEKEQIHSAINDFRTKQKLSNEDFINWLFASKQDKEDKELYADFWKRVTASLEGRPNRAVRIFVRRLLHPKTSQGAWSNVELLKLKNAVQAKGENWSVVAKSVGTRNAEDCRLRWRDFAPTVNEAKKKGEYTEEDTQKLTAAVRTICEEAGLDPMSPCTKIPWKLVSREIDGERTPAHCLTKWQAMLKELKGGEGPFRWTLNDSKIFIDRLTKENNALEKDDFTEVKLSSLRGSDWLMEPKSLLHCWKRLVAKYISPTADYKTNFRSNLKSIKYTILLLQDESTARKQPLVGRAKEDLIDSDEEV